MASGGISVSIGEASPLGVTVREDGINLAVLSRHADQVSVCLFDDGGDRELARFVLPGRSGTDVHHGFIAGVRPGARYGLRVEGPFDPARGHRFDPAKLLVDPYARRLDRPFAWHPDLAAPRSAAVDTAPIVPKAIVVEAGPHATSLAPGNPGFIYEIAVKAFTQRHPAVPALLRGTIAALAHPSVIDHLATLGVDTVELMPIAAWIDERHLPALRLQNGWGYNPVTFMAPDPRIAPGGVSEIRNAVEALHAAGIRVLLDVVMNHTGESDTEGATLSLRGLDNALYYRHAAGDPGKLVNDTGCGNTLAVERAPVVRLVMDALRHWVLQTGVDGFRFDLAAVLGRTPHGFSADAPLFAAIGQDPCLAGLTFVAEPWDVGPDGYRLGQFPASWLEWNDRYRDDVRRFWRDGDAGALATRLAGSSDAFAGKHAPSRSVNYVAAHDGFTLRDLVSYGSKHNQANGEGNRDGSAHEVSWNNGVEGPTADADIEARRGRDMRALLATLMVSRGTPMLTAGDEFGRTQQGNNNAYAQDNETTWLDWDKADRTLLEFVAQLVGLRRSHRALSADRFLTGRPMDDTGIPDAAWLTPDGRAMTDRDWAGPTTPALGLALYAPSVGAVPSDRVCLWINRDATAIAVSPPAPRPGFAWQVAGDSSRGRADLAEELDADRLTVPGRSVIGLVEAAGGRRSTGRQADDATIDRLATAVGMNAEWWSLDGIYHRVTPETKRALLRAMRLPAETAADASRTLAAMEREKDARSLPVVQLLAEGAAGSLRLAVPERSGDRSLSLSVRLNGGGVQRIEIAPGELRDVGRATVGGESVRHLAVPLPALPPGYHEVVVDDDAEAGCSLIVSPATCFLDERIAGGAKLYGLTSHLYAMRHRQDAGVGDLETLARFGEAAAKLGGAVAGINPLHHLFPTDRDRASPYQPSDRNFIDPIYIDLAGLVAGGHSPRAAALLQESAGTITGLVERPYIDYRGVWDLKRRILAAAFADFATGSPEIQKDFVAYKRAAGAGLRQHAVFEALAEQAGSVDRSRWAAEWRSPDNPGVADFADANAGAVEFRMWLQWIADRQLAAAAARSRAAGLGLGLYRDLALGTAFDGGEIWADAGQFATGVSLGAPPDPFARDGQVWQLAPFAPRALAQSGYAAFRAMLAANMRHAGLLRIDHVLGFMRQFWVPEGAPGKDGAYVDFPLDALIAITAIESRRARCTIVGEDLGTVPDGLRERLRGAGILSYRVLWFEKEGEQFRPPASYPALSVSCVSSHDLPTFVGWRQGRDIEIEREQGKLSAPEAAARLQERRREEQSLRAAMGQAGLDSADSDADLMAAAHAFLARTPSTLALVQTDDLWEETEPLNVPGTDRERPNWRRRQRGPVEELPDRPLSRQVMAAVRQGRRDAG
ncbi:MAG TPA: glycogen debranching protein GlgX [Methylomirabilota bacterium]|nr:glycogen debranching protein GlgX [Methylomirabilota bacterium]